ncbi:MAG: polysaccharide biosynthesis tyrosine autokinase, partial [Desulfobacteraceae bacterium]|nr:polysaccharide biosynthesis tyrosine autokinase [Desulfobacteraceae bacterium]
LVNISADGAQVLVPYHEGVIQGLFGRQKPVFKKGEFIGLRFTPMPYQTPLMFNARIRNILQIGDNKSISIGLQIIGLDSTPQGQQVLSRLVETVKQYYQINQSNAKQQDGLGGPAPCGKPVVSAEKSAFRIVVSRKMSTASKHRASWNLSGEYERLKNNILSLNSERAVKTIMVVSSVSKEGCSTVASNFAMTLAKNSSLNVLLIDGNFRHPTLHVAFRVENKTGLSDLVLGNADISEAIKKTNLPNLSMITSGDFRENPIEVLESSNLKGLIVKLKDQFDYLILDSAPVNTYSDSCILASQVDGVILVIHAGKTRWEVAQNAKRQLEMTHATILGVVLNRKKYVIPTFLYKRL